MADIVLGSLSAGPGHPPYVIAEIGVNHEGSLELARRLIDLAKEGGAHAAKFQSYKAEKLAAAQSPAYWDLRSEPTPNQRQLFKKYDRFGPAEYEALARHCESVNIQFCSTPFDDEAVDILDGLMPYFKIASADVTNLPLLRKVASKGKPVVLSTGASTLGEVDMAVAELKRHGAPAIALLHCVLNYPCPNANAHLDMITGLRRAYPDHVIGYSDHTLPGDMLVCVGAWLLGAAIIEKHFTHDKTLPGNDHYHAMDAGDLKRFHTQVALLREVRGPTVHKAPLDEEAPARIHARRSIVTARALAAGATLTAEVLTTKRPAHGISPLHWDEVMGRKLARDLSEDHILTWSDLA